MKLVHLVVVGLALASGALSAQVIPVVSPGTPYERVRAELLKAGWKPVRQTESCGIVCQGHRRAGWPETWNCADTGVAPCVFVFRNASGKALEVVTRGEAPHFNGFR